MKKILTIAFISILVFTLTGCDTKTETDALKFKNEYESLNGKENASGKEHRTISIKEDNPFIYATAEEIIEKINNEETFYVYFGSALCPWCRSVIEQVIEVAKEKNIKTIYYVDIWDEEGNEILRDKYKLEDGVAVMDIEGTESYYELLKHFDNLLSDYSLTDSDGNSISTNEKRIYAPSLIYLEDGQALKITDGTSDKQVDSRAELTDEVLKDEQTLLNNFFEQTK